VFKSFSEIYNSRVHFVDFWLTIYILTTAFICLFSRPLENISVYTNLTDNGVTSELLGYFLISIGLFNLLRLLLVKKVSIYITILLKSLMLFSFALLLFGILANPVLPLTTGYLTVACLLSIDNIIHT